MDLALNRYVPGGAMLSCCRAKAGLFSVMAFLAALPGCTGVPDLAERTARAELIILHSHQELRIDTGSFELMSFVPRQKVAEPVESLFIFIEGVLPLQIPSETMLWQLQIIITKY